MRAELLHPAKTGSGEGVRPACGADQRVCVQERPELSLEGAGQLVHEHLDLARLALMVGEVDEVDAAGQVGWEGLGVGLRFVAAVATPRLRRVAVAVGGVGGVGVAVDRHERPVVVDEDAAELGVGEELAGLLGTDQAEAGDLRGLLAAFEGGEADHDQGLPGRRSGAAADQVGQGIEPALRHGAAVPRLLRAGVGVDRGPQHRDLPLAPQRGEDRVVVERLREHRPVLLGLLKPPRRGLGVDDHDRGLRREPHLTRRPHPRPADPADPITRSMTCACWASVSPTPLITSSSASACRMLHPPSARGSATCAITTGKATNRRACSSRVCIVRGLSPNAGASSSQA